MSGTVALQNTNLRIPEYVRETYPLFYKFMVHYYTWLGLDGNPGDLSVDSYRSIDQCPDSHLEFLAKEFLPDFPTMSASTLRLVLRHHLDFYTSKGSEESIKFLIRALYGDETVEFNYPQDWMLNASDTEYSNPLVLMFRSTNVNAPNMENAIVYGLTSGNRARVDNVSKLTYTGIDYWIITLSDLVGDFAKDTQVSLTKGAINFTVTLEKVYGDVVIDAPGSGYVEGEVITKGDSEFVITETSEGYIDYLRIVKPGSNYQAGDLIILSEDDDRFSPATIYGVAEVNKVGGILRLETVQRGGPYKQIPIPRFDFSHRTTGTPSVSGLAFAATRSGVQSAALGEGAVVQPIAPNIGRVEKIELKSLRPQTRTQTYSVEKRNARLIGEQLFLNNWEGSVRLYPTPRKNFVRHSERFDFMSSSWDVPNTGGRTPTPYLAFTPDNTVVTPWGAASSKLQTLHASSPIAYRMQQTLRNVRPGPVGTYHLTTLLKPGTVSKVAIKIMDEAGVVEYHSATIDLVSNVSSSLVQASVSIATLANGWKKVSITGTKGVYTPNILLQLYALDNNFQQTWNAVGTESMWVGMFQFEEDHTTSYIPTEALERTVTDYTISRTGVISFWADPVQETRKNLALKSDTFEPGFGWSTNGTGALTLNSIISPNGLYNGHLISGLGAVGTSNYVQNITSLDPSTENTISFYLKKLSASGKIALVNADDSGNGYWVIDLSKVSEKWERIHSRHPAVSVKARFVSQPGGALAYRLHDYNGSGVLRFYLNGFQVELGNNHQEYIPTDIETVSRVVTVYPDTQTLDNAHRKFGPVHYTRTNKQLWSNVFTNPVWLTNGGSVVLTPGVEGPDGSNTATVVESAPWSLGQDLERRLEQQDANRFQVGTQITMSCWIKLLPEVEDALPTVQFYNYAGGLSTELNVTEQWQRFTWTTYALSGDKYGLRFGWASSGAKNGNKFALWGFQVEEGPEATEYIDTLSTPFSVAATRYPTITWNGKIVDWEDNEIVVTNEPILFNPTRPDGTYQLISNHLLKASGDGRLKFTPKLVKLGKLIAGHRTQKGLTSGASKFGDDKYFHHFHYCIRTVVAENVTPAMTNISGHGVAGASVAGQEHSGSAASVIKKLAHPAGIKMSWERHGSQNICGEGLAGRSIAGNPNSIPATDWTNDSYNFYDGLQLPAPLLNYAVQ